MKEPRLSDLKTDERGTRQIRRRMAAARHVKITINIDSDNLDILRAKSAATGIPYQRLLNQLLAQALASNRESESRLDRLEMEVKKLKKRIVA
jgi:predicted DNA binding CopG/RHH family protein